MRIRFGVLSGVAAVWLLGGGAGLWAHGLGARPGTAEENAYVAAASTEARSVAPNALAHARVDEERRLSPSVQIAAVATRPSAVDNSALPWFPPIGDQGYQNSCVAWAAGYYYSTYTQAMDEGIDVSGGDRAHVCSPAFLYPLMNDGTDEGAFLDYAMARLDVIGCSSLSLTPYKLDDYTSWPSEAAWVDALNRRTQDLYRISSHTAEGLAAVEQLLANGRLAVVMVDMYANLYSDYPRGPGLDGDVLYAPGGPYLGGHALTLVGYDDTKTYHDGRDGQTHTGAFLVANSWGSSWGVANTKGSTGYLWISYDAFLENAFVYDVLYTDDRPHYRPVVYALVGLADRQRGSLDLRGGAGLPSAPDGVTSPVLSQSGGTQLGVSASQRIAVDLTDLAQPLHGGRLADLFISLNVSPRTSSAGAIASAEFFADVNGDGTYESFPAPSLPITVDDGATGYAFLPLFSDVNWDNWAYDGIESCFDAGIVSGYLDGGYHPEAAVARDQMAVYLSRALAGGDAAVPPGPAAPTFADIPSDYWAYRYVEYTKAQNVIQGYADGYHPSETVDRAQMAVYVARSIVTPTGDAGLASYTPSSAPSFADVSVGYWAYKHIEYCKAHQIVNGYGVNYRHEEAVTRDQMAVYIARAFVSLG